jgi:hypothetical protein
MVLTALFVGFQNCADSVPTGGRSSLSSSNILNIVAASDLVGAGQSITLTTTGGQPPYNYNIISGSGSLVPQTDNAVVNFTAPAGTPAQPTTTIRVTDASGASADRTIATTAGLTVTYTPAAPTKYDSVTLTGINGTAPYTLKRLSGPGSLAGTIFSPGSNAGTTNFEITDATGAKAGFNITVTNPALVTLYRIYDSTTGEYYTSELQNGEDGTYGSQMGAFYLFKTQLAGTLPIYKCQASVGSINPSSAHIVFSYTACAAGAVIGNNAVFGYYSSATRPNTRVLYYPNASTQFLSGNTFPMSVTIEPSDIQYRGGTATQLGFAPR